MLNRAIRFYAFGMIFAFGASVMSSASMAATLSASVGGVPVGAGAQTQTGAAHLTFVAPGQRGQTGIGKAHHLQLAQGGGIGRQSVVAHLRLNLDDFADPRQKPRIE